MHLVDGLVIVDRQKAQMREAEGFKVIEAGRVALRALAPFLDHAEVFSFVDDVRARRDRHVADVGLVDDGVGRAIHHRQRFAEGGDVVEARGVQDDGGAPVLRARFRVGVGHLADDFAVADDEKVFAPFAIAFDA